MIERLQRLRDRLAADALDGFIVARPENRRYMSGFTGTAGTILITQRAAWFIADFRYVEQAKAQCIGYEVVPQGDTLLDTMEALLKTAGVKRLGFEQDYLTYGDVLAWRQLETRIPGLQLVATSQVVDTLRMVKDAGEVAAIERAAAVADAGFDFILGILRPGVKEADVAFELEMFMRKRGASAVSFETIVASGWRSALPHGVASDKTIASGELVTLDFGAVVDGYSSDITRTVVVGTPTDEQKRVYQVVLDAQLRAIEAVAAGKTGKELDAVARDFLAQHQLGDAFGHSLGHGIGLEIHEGPRLSKVSEDVLAPGMVVTVEPGVYLPGWGGVRIEDDLLVESGGGRILTHSPKRDLISI
ncbi:Xaa-Pro aminopeptidase [Alicyclobacillus cycloheptanicus]|uniref:Xaa-Pro aminopeptidase n=1 Tax=Alicyclobacillus cycloheptanicus TaxID=1457 RepID=A0ABT9XDY2_9BACL|nr:Xaa-Pro aminopeptidase [Alicyclobacillus cycloheptanicus]